MAKAKLYNLEGKEQGSVDLNDAVFAVEPKQDLVHQVYVALTANARQPLAHTKDRSEVRGGGRKPWKQKGTGRARHGSSRSPIWRSGGVTFGPLKTRNFKQKINKKVNKQAVKMCLTGKLKEDKLIVLESFPTDGLTKQISQMRKDLPGEHKTALFVTPGKDQKIMQASKNVSSTDVKRAEDINIVDLLHHQYIFVSKETINTLEKRLS